MGDLPPVKRMPRQWRMTNKKQFEEADKVVHVQKGLTYLIKYGTNHKET